MQITLWVQEKSPTMDDVYLVQYTIQVINWSIFIYEMRQPRGRNKTQDQRPGPGTKIRYQILSAEYACIDLKGPHWP